MWSWITNPTTYGFESNTWFWEDWYDYANGNTGQENYTLPLPIDNESASIIDYPSLVESDFNIKSWLIGGALILILYKVK